jgi:hypothetical protein
LIKRIDYWQISPLNVGTPGLHCDRPLKTTLFSIHYERDHQTRDFSLDSHRL